jgi:hypothetical protein
VKNETKAEERILWPIRRELSQKKVLIVPDFQLSLGKGITPINISLRDVRHLNFLVIRKLISITGNNHVAGKRLDDPQSLIQQTVEGEISILSNDVSRFFTKS